MRFKLSIIFFFIFFSRFAFSVEELVISHFQKHSRYEYGAEVLELALSKLNTPYQIKTVVPNNEFLNEARGKLEVIAGHIDIEWMSTNVARETQMIPIKIPLYQGMLGLRLLLVNNHQHQILSKVRTLQDLQQLTAGHGLHWADLSVYGANDLSVLPHKDYESIFKLLELGRIDYFHRGLNEIWSELNQHNDSLSIADNVMLYYPLPVYFFVTKTKPELANLLEKGLLLAIKDGSFKELFEEKMGDFIVKGKLETRTLITLKNPDLPPNTPFIETNWWLPEKFNTLMKSEFLK